MSRTGEEMKLCINANCPNFMKPADGKGGKKQARSRLFSEPFTRW